MKLFDLMDTAFSTFDNTVRTYLQKTFNDLGVNYTHNQIFGVIFDGIKGIMQNVMFYIEDAFTEQNIFTAQRKQSIYSLAKISGYEPYYGAAATGTVYCTTHVENPAALQSSRIYIQNHTVLINKFTNLFYTIILPTNYYIIDLNKPLMTHEFKIIQGTFKTSTYIMKGLTLETINLTSIANYDAQYITVTVNGEEWTPVSNLYEMTENSKNYIAMPGYDNSLSIMFGNGIHGQIPEKGSSVIIKYINHVGTAGNINTYDKYSLRFHTTANDSTGNSINVNDYASLSIHQMVTGGQNPDSIEFVKQMIGYNSRSNVLASEENYKLYLLRFSFISQCTVWSEENTSCVIISALSNYFNNNNNVDNYFNVDINKFYLTSEQKQIITETLDKSNKTITGISLKFEDPVIRKYAILCYIKLNTVYNQDDVKTHIKSIVANYFINLKTGTQFIAKSDIIKEILDNDDNIESLDIVFISDLAEQTFANGYYYKYYMEYVNNGYFFNKQKVFYESTKTPGLDEYGNISLDTKLEMPILRGGFKYFPNKENDDKSESIMIDTLEVFFI